MSGIEFKVGYYEWHIYLNGELFYTFLGDDDVLLNGIYSIEHPEDYYEDERFASLEEIVDWFIDDMQRILEEDDKEPLEEKYIPELKKQMIEQWGWHFGVTV